MQRMFQMPSLLQKTNKHAVSASDLAWWWTVVREMYKHYFTKCKYQESCFPAFCQCCGEKVKVLQLCNNMQNSFIELFILWLFMRYVLEDIIFPTITLDKNLLVLLCVLLLRERRPLFVLCKSFSLKESSLSLHHFVFDLSVNQPQCTLIFVPVFEVCFEYLLLLYLHLLSCCLSTCKSSSNLWSRPQGKPATEAHTFPQLNESSVLLTIKYFQLIEMHNAGKFSNEQSLDGKKKWC